jgi:serine phosphatase RsbU (regulator of sigma subunit)
LPTCLATDYELHLNLSDILVITSDGIPEAPQLMGKMLGYDNMLQLIELYRHESTETLGRVLLQAANVYQMPNDDQTLIIIKRVA